MNKKVLLCALAWPLFFSGCSRHFGPLYAEAKVDYAEGNWIETIDNINLALPFWRESDGQEEKAQAYQLLGKAYHKLKKIDKATEAYSKAVELSTNTFDSAYEMGMIYLTAKQMNAAVAAFKEALKMKKDDPYALLGLGNAYYDEANYEDARVMYQRVIDSSPGVREALDYLGLIDDKRKQKVETKVIKTRRGYMRIKKR